MKTISRLRILPILGIALLGIASIPANGQSDAPAVAITGAVQKPTQWTTPQLEKQFAEEIKTVSYTLKDKSHTARCIPFWSLLRAATPAPSDEKRKNGVLSLVITVTAGDGYAAAFSYGELSPEYGKATVYVALDRDGKPLTDKEGPVELLVTGDGKPSRWVHGVRQIIVRDTAPVATVK